MENNQPVRVLVNAPLRTGGVTNMMLQIQKHMDKRKVNFDYLTFFDKEEPKEALALSMGSRKLVASSASHIFFKPFRRLIRMNEIRKQCKMNNIKILHYNADCPADLTNIIAARLGGVQYVTIHSHNAGFGTAGREYRILSSIMKPFIPLFCDNFLGCSDLAARFMFPKSVIEKENYCVLPNGIELEKYKFSHQTRMKVRKELDLEGKFVVGHAGRFVDQKNHNYLLNIFKVIHEKDNNTVLLLFGTGELLEPMKQKAKMLGMSDAVIFYGVSDRMEEMWQAMDVVLMPSFHEGLPVTGIEAQASGLPCVLSDCITREVNITGKVEFLSLDASLEVWADTVLKHRNEKRTSSIDELKNAGYDIQKTADMVTEFYLKVAKKYLEFNTEWKKYDIY